MSSVELLDVAKNYGPVEVFRDINLSFAHGQFIALLGPSGCGKSTLLRCVAGLEDLTYGDIRFAGRSVADVAPSKRGAAMVFQSYALYPHKTVAENMGFALRIAGKPKDEIDRKVLEAARILNITDYLDKRPRQLSGGQRQRVAIGRAIVRNPEVFLFDEPLSNLDAELRARMRVELARLHRRLGATMLYVTHDQIEAMTMADRIVVLHQGRVRQIGSPEEVFENPADLFVARFIGAPPMNVLEASKFPELARAAGKRFGGALKTGARLGVRPQDVRPGKSGECRLDVTIDAIESLGRERLFYGMIGDDGDFIASLRKGDSQPQEGPMTFSFDLANLHAFDASGNRLAG